MQMRLTQEQVRQEFRDLKKNTNKPEMLEILDVCFETDDGYFFKEPSETYAHDEHVWYMSESLDVRDLNNTPKIWREIACDNFLINSNYGFLALSKENGSQFDNVIEKLKTDKNSRQGTLVYTRPSIHVQAVENGRSDFICTTHQHIRIHDNKLNFLSSMRSNDAIFGFSYDVQWARFLHEKAYDELKIVYPDLEMGKLNWFASTLHIYPRHYDLVK